jgi:hypothetical protein
MSAPQLYCAEGGSFVFSSSDSYALDILYAEGGYFKESALGIYTTYKFILALNFFFWILVGIPRGYEI